MFYIGLFIGILIGANLGVFIYACIIAAKESDERTYN